MRKGLIIFFLFGFMIPTNKLIAQDQETQNRKIGISAAILDNQVGLLLPIWITNKISIAPAISFSYAQKIGSDYSIGIVPKFYLNTKKIAPFIDFRVGSLINAPTSDNQTTTTKTIDWLWGAGFGGEYFLDYNFSFGIELQGNFTKSDINSDRFGNPGGLNFNTATVVSANIYF